ncbi:hypothetical protein BUALT_Bualt10G0060200 [Buddleja alternifolia]|uniref:Glycosyltransferase N-terminal domain-containing protein n=1 Tax=Buddleja alternifolia TaxID=168488 RepID=A0AAV6WVL8_9LAMI|nr:hypothetical protein BUALT_Bualt10G0060200 [Buddleja alternifolia]
MAMVKGKKPHVLAVPLPFQGHVKPLMKLCRQIAKRGIKVTFVNIQSIHEKLILTAKMSDHEDEEDNIVLTSIPDSRSPEEIDKNNAFKLLETLRHTMPDSLTDLIERINSSNDEEKISCVIADITIDWVLETAEKMGAEPVVFSPPAAAVLTIALHTPKLIEEGYIDSNGITFSFCHREKCSYSPSNIHCDYFFLNAGSILKGDQIISLSENMPALRTNDLNWNFIPDLEAQKILFECSLRVGKAVNQAKMLLVNTSYELESAACDLNPKLIPIGPLIQTHTLKSSSNSWSFHSEDESCLTWLNNKPLGSVIYVSFGSLAIFSQHQLDELALGLELSGHPFLWVVRSDLANGSRAVYPDGFMERIRGFGKIVEWAPQEEVLSHPSVAGFLSHCGWNSVVEGLNMGMPFLCWPYGGDQFHNQDYICDKWEIGLRINPDENSIRTKEEIKTKIEMLFSDDNLKLNALKMKEMIVKSVSEGGSSYKNLENFIDHLRN